VAHGGQSLCENWQNRHFPNEQSISYAVEKAEKTSFHTDSDVGYLVGYLVPPARRADFINELLTQDTSFPATEGKGRGGTDRGSPSGQSLNNRCPAGTSAYAERTWPRCGSG